MTQTTPTANLLDVAQRLLVYEGSRRSSGQNTSATFLVSEKLRRSLIRLVGMVGFSSLLSRSLTLAKAKVAALCVVQIKPDGSLEGLDSISDEDRTEAGAVLIAHLMALLVLFIGEPLTLKIVHDAWPDLPVSERTTLETNEL